MNTGSNKIDKYYTQSYVENDKSVECFVNVIQTYDGTVYLYKGTKEQLPTLPSDVLHPEGITKELFWELYNS